jgi:hypothetical protein
MKGKCGFASINAKEEIVYTIGIIASVENIKIYEVVERSVKESYPEYFETQLENEQVLCNI